MKRFFTLLMSLIVLTGCVQDSPNVKQIANMKFFIENQAQDGINVIEKGLHYAVLNSGITFRFCIALPSNCNRPKLLVSYTLL